MLYGEDMARPRQHLKGIVISSARRVIAEMSTAQATGPDAVRAIFEQVGREVSSWGLNIKEHSLRYVTFSR
jgi:hypothetical protein